MEKVYILGGSQTDFERNWKKEGKGYIALLKECFEEAISSCNITKEEIYRLNEENRVECFVGNFISELFINQGHIGALLTNVDELFYGMPSARYEAACASGSVAIDNAVSKIKANEIDMAIVVGFELMKTVDSRTCSDFLGRAAIYENEAKGIEYPFPKLFGKLADEILTKYELNEDRFMDNLAQISTFNYENAKRNPNAQTRKWFMSKEHAKSRNTKYNPLIGGRLAISDCSQVTDGAAIIFLVSQQYLINKKKNLKEYPIIKATGHRVAPMSFDKKMKDNENSEYVLPWTRKAIEEAYTKANMTVKDIDFFETHDCFTSSEYAAISCFGITKPGEEYKAIESGAISFQGEQPINPSGGLIGCGHPVGATGVRMMLDLYKQITNKAGDYQLDSPKNGMMLNIGGSGTTNYVFIVGKNVERE